MTRWGAVVAAVILASVLVLAIRGSRGPRSPAPEPPRATCTVAGRVQAWESRLPVAGRVVVAVQEGRTFRSEPLGEDGLYVIEGLSSGALVLLAVEGCAPARQAFPAWPGDRCGADLDLFAGGPLDARVVDGSGRPVPGARVSVTPYFELDWPADMEDVPAPAPVAEALTGPDGIARFADPPRGFAHWRVEAPGSGRIDTFEGVGDTDHPVQFTLSGPASLTGRVLDAEGRPVPDARVVATEAGTNDAMSAIVSPGTRTDAAGGFHLTGLSADLVDLRVALPGAAPRSLARVRLPGVQRIDLMLPPTARIHGRVTDRLTGRPIAGARVHGSSWSFNADAVATTGGDGRYGIGSLPEGGLAVSWVVKQGYAPFYSAQSSEERPGVELECDIALLPARCYIEGRVTSPAGPVGGALVESGDEDAVTDGRGRYRLGPLAEGEHGVSARHPAFLSGDPKTVRVSEGAVAAADFELRPGLGVEVLLRDPAGCPLYWGVSVMVDAEDVGLTAEGGTERRFEVRGLSPGSVIVRVRAPWCPREVVRRVEPADPPARLEVILPAMPAPRSARVRVRAVDGPVPPGAGVETVWSRSGVFDWSSGGRWPVDADGVAEISGREPRVLLRAVAPGHTPGAPVEISLDEEESAGRVLVLGPGHPVAGVVRAGEDGAAVGGAWVCLCTGGSEAAGEAARDDPFTVHAVAADDGSFALDPVPPGDYAVVARAPGFLQGHATLRVPADGPVEVDLVRARVLGGRLLQADGSPAAGVLLRASAAEREAEPEAFTRGDGRFLFRDLAPGRWTIEPEAGDATSAVVPGDLGSCEAGATDLVLTLPAGAEIRGRVLDEEGRGIADARFQASNGAGGRKSGEAGPEGDFVVRGVRPGTVDLRISAAGYLGRVLTGVEAGATGLEVRLSRGLGIAGVVLTETGTPVSGLLIFAEPVDPVDPSLDVEQVADPSDAGGRFEVRGLAAGSYRLVVARPHMTLAGEVLLGGKSVEAGRNDVRLVLAPGAVVAGFVTDEEGRPVPGALVFGSTGEGADGGGDETLTDGSFEIEGLAPGRSCLLSARAPGRAAARLYYTPSESSRRSQISRERAPEAPAAAGGEEGEAAPAASAGEDLPPPPSRQRGRGPSQTRLRAVPALWDVPAGSRDLRIVLPRTKPISGVLLDAAGRPVAGVRLTFVPRGNFEELHVETDAGGRFRVDAAPATCDVELYPGIVLGTMEGGAQDVVLRMK
jgi:protocatechuate 3,4-dioxygenase beta subunit